MSNFSLTEFMQNSELALKKSMTEYIEISKIHSNNDNFYGIRDIEKLKESILLMDGVQEPVILEKKDDKYLLLAGHRRVEACRELVKDGYDKYSTIPAIVKENLSERDKKAILLLTNSTQRGELTDYEKVMQHVEIKHMLAEFKKENGLEGKLREMEAEYLGVSSGQISIYNKIYKNLSKILMLPFSNGHFGISVAAECASCTPEEQLQLYEHFNSYGSLSIEDVRRVTKKDLIKGQMTFEVEADEDDEPVEVINEKIITQEIPKAIKSEELIKNEPDAIPKPIKKDIFKVRIYSTSGGGEKYFSTLEECYDYINKQHDKYSDIKQVTIVF